MRSSRPKFLPAILLALLTVACAPPITPSPLPTPSLPSPNTFWVDAKAKADGKVIFNTIAEAIKKSNGQAIYIVPGEYKESLTIPAKTTVTLIGETSHPAKILPPDGKPGLTVEEGGTLFLRHMILKGGERGIHLKKQTKLTCHHVMLQEMTGQAIFGEDTQVQLFDTTIKDIKETPKARFKAIGQAQGIRLSNSILTVQNCTFHNTRERGSNLLNKSTGTFLASTFTNTYEFSVAAIAFQGKSTGLVQNVQMTGWKEGIFSNDSYFIARSVSIKESSGNAIFASYNSHILVEDSKIDSPKRSGVSLSLSSGTVRNTEIINAGEYGIFAVQGKEQRLLLFENNTVNHSVASGIQVVHSLAHIIGNTVKKSQYGKSKDDGYGIGALDSEYLLVERNTVTECVGSGIFLNRSFGRIAENIIKQNKEGGILITTAPKGSTIYIESNQLEKNTIAGIFLLATQAILSKNKISQTIFAPAEQSGTGVVLFGATQATLTQETYEQNSQHGLLVAQNSKANVTNSKFSQNKQFGILVQCGNSSITEEKNTYDHNSSGSRNKCP